MNVTENFWTALQTLTLAHKTGMRYEDEPLSMRKLFTASAAKYELTLNDLMSNKRQRDVVKARNLGIVAALRHTRNGYSDVGRFLRKDHTTVIHSEKKVVQDNCPDNLDRELEEIVRIAKVY